MSVGVRMVRLLDPHTVNQIAAGEVVERPASVVKELVENALDAGARKIEVDLEASGKARIRVADDGCGMSEEDARAALQRHATSKIRSAEDLRTVKTLGFRGEALPSIASVARLTLVSAPEDGRRLVLRAEGGHIEPIDWAAGPKGTEVTVEDLFYNVPARLKFLKSDGTELGQCLEVVSRLALAAPWVSFQVTHNGQLAFRTGGTGDLHAAIQDVWSRDLARALAEVDLEAAGLRVRGFVSPPHVTRPTRTYQYLSVNGRPVRARLLTIALDQAYRDLTPDRRFPIVALDLEVDPDRVDVNVSPTKTEVKFQHEGSVFDALRLAVRSALMEHGMMPPAGSMGGAERANEALRASEGVGSSVGLGWSQGFAEQRPFGYLPGNPGQLSLDAQAPLPASGMEVPATLRTGVDRERFPFADLLEGLRVIGQAMNTFILAETARGLVVIDQHVAHERILYEYLCGLKGPTAIERQALLVPQPLHLDRRSAVLLGERIGEVQALGFDLEPFGGDTFVVRSAPAALRGKDPVRLLRDLVEELVETTVTRRLVPTREQIWITSACKMAVKAGDPLSLAEMEKLIVDLAGTENPYLCPHGRPITVTLGTEELLRKFKRT